jgi:RNA polymerase sigma factor (sigma-70 family)
MANPQLDHLVHSIRQLAGVPSGTELTDRQLLERFVGTRSETAFAALVERHGALVLGVCRRVLDHVQDAEDAFQATFLVLARKAGAVRWQEEISDWIHAVAYRTALKARGEAARRRGRERPLIDLPAPETDSGLAWQELRPILDEEVRRLPEKYRAPLVLCYFEEKTYAEAAHVLGVAEGTVSSRLARARDRLRIRLVRRGLALSAALLSTTVARDAIAASVPANLLQSTIQTAVLSLTEQAGAVSTPVAILVERVLRAMFWIKLKTATGVLLAISLAGGGAGLLSYRALAATGTPAELQQAESPKKEQLQLENEELKREIQVLRDQVAQLRKEMEQRAALSKRRVNSEAPGKSVTYQGKSASFWVEQLKDRAPDYRVSAVKALGGIAEVDNSVVPVIAESFKDRDFNVRIYAALAVAKLGTNGIAILTGKLKDKEVNARLAAVRGLSEIARSDATAVGPLLAEALKDDSPLVRSTASQALSDLGPDGIAILARMLKDKDVNARLAAVGGLSRDTSLEMMGRVRPVLLEALKDDSPQVRDAASAALSRTGYDRRAPR